MPAPIRGTWYNRPGWSEYKAARGNGQKHWGYDSYTVPHATIYAISIGVVVGKGYAAGGFGHYVDVFYPGLKVRQREAHMNEASHLSRGAQVTSSTALGRVGRTGNAKNIYWIRNGVELWHVHSQAWRGNTTNGDLNVDPRNYWGGTAGDIIIPTIRRDGENMATTYYCTADDKPKGKILEWAKGGDSPGTPANWRPTTQQTVANGYARSTGGKAVHLSRSSYALAREQYTAPLQTTAAIDSKVIGDAVAAAVALALGSAPTGGASKADVDAAAAKVIQALPTKLTGTLSE